MKKLTKEERKEIYLQLAEIISEKIEIDSMCFICTMLVHRLHIQVTDIKDTIEKFPELGLTIVDESGCSWNDYKDQSMEKDTQERIYAVLLAMQMCN